MPNHTSQRIASLRELIKAGLYQENLDKIVAICNALAQDTSYVLTFFVFKQMFREMAAALDAEAVSPEQHLDLIVETADTAILILDKVANGEKIEADELEAMVGTHIRNLNVFKSDR
jgi:hypothetical protein